MRTKIIEPLNFTKCGYIWYVKFEDGAIKCEKEKKEPPNLTKVQSDTMLVLPNMTME